MQQMGWMKPKEAANYAGVGHCTVRGWIKNGLRHSRIGGVILIRRENLDEFLERFAAKDTGQAVDRIVDDVLRGL